MLLPRFTIRQIFAITTLCAVACLILSAAVVGRVWAIGIIAALLTLGMCFACYALIFVVSFAFGISMRPPSQAPDSPFARDKAPPQVVSPRHDQ